MLGSILNHHYRITQELGQGACGRTYLVKDLNHQTQPYFVLKQLQPDYSSCQSPVEKELLWQVAKKFFEREVPALQELSLHSSQIATIEDYFDEDYQFYIVQEWMEAEVLSIQLQPGMRWNQQETMRLLVEILEPLNFCHQEGVIHRGLQPDSLMRRRNGELAIVDFGAVQEIGQLTMFDGRPRSSLVMGTLGYMPIEQLRGSPVLASDIYAVGAIGMQALTGLYPDEIPFDLDTGIPAWRETPDCYVTDVFANVLNRMLATLPDVRYRDAAAALLALQPLRSTLRASSPSMSPPPQPPAPSQPSEPTFKPPAPQFRGNLSQKIFTYESAKLQHVDEQQSEKKSGWLGGEMSGWLVEEVSGLLGIGAKEERPTKRVNTWQVNKTTGKAKCFVEDLGNGLQLEMVYIPAGTFTMGAPLQEADSLNNERPQHLVTVPAFYMGRYPVTQEQYVAIVGNNPACRQGVQLPVENISWHDAQKFCQQLSAKTVRKYRLPSEAEWEYACRAGITTPFHFGERITTEVANFNGNYTYANAPLGQFREQTTVVGSFPANDFGLSDMHGNVWEWCEDHWHSNYEGAPIDGSAAVDLDASVNSVRILRGGSWFRNPLVCRSAYRYKYASDFHFNDIGFRVVYAFRKDSLA